MAVFSESVVVLLVRSILRLLSSRVGTATWALKWFCRRIGQGHVEIIYRIYRLPCSKHPAGHTCTKASAQPTSLSFRSIHRFNLTPLNREPFSGAFLKPTEVGSDGRRPLYRLLRAGLRAVEKGSADSSPCFTVRGLVCKLRKSTWHVYMARKSGYVEGCHDEKKVWASSRKC